MSLESSKRPGGQRRRRVTDPLAIRAVAHPIRLELLSFIGRTPGMTTADAARELDISHGLASHHLHQLAKYGFVEQVAGRDNRERPWRIVHTSIDWERELSAENAAAGRMLDAVSAEAALGRLLGWLDRRAEWPDEWREQTGVGHGTVYLTLAELTELNATMEAAIGRYVEQRPIDDVNSRPVGSVPVNYTLFVVPLSKRPGET